MTCAYVHPPVYNVPPEFQVDVPKEIKTTSREVQTVEEAIEVYMQAFHQKFQSKEGRRHRRQSLELFLQYLAAHGNSLKLTELTLTDGQDFIDSLVNRKNDMPLRFSEKKKYRSALRSLSRFLYILGIIEENVFLPITMN